MHIIEVLPTVKIPLPNLQALSYLHEEELASGALVSIPLGRRQITGIVLSSKKVSEKEIEEADYKIKPINKVIANTRIVEEKQLKLITELADYYYAPPTLFLKTILPSILLNPTKPVVKELNEALHENEQKNKPKKNKNQSQQPEIFIGKTAQRFAFYQKEIKKSIHKGSILYLAPENFQLSAAIKEFSLLAKETIVWRNPSLNDFEDVKIQKNATPKQQFRQWLLIKKAGAGCLVLGTRSAVFAPLENPSLIILDEEENSSHKSWDLQPYYHAREAAIKMAKINNCRIILGAQIPSVSTCFHYAKNNPPSQNKKNTDIQTAPKKKNILVTDMKQEIKRGNFSIFSEELKKNLTQKKQSFLFINRRGFSSFVLCRDCGYIPQCPHCAVPLVYHMANKWLICHHCGRPQKSFSSCPQCQGYKIKFFGSGTQKVEMEMENNFPDLKFSRLDSDNAPQLEQQIKIVEQFAERKIQVLIATQIGIKFLDLLQPELIGIISMETMLNLPDFSGTEKVFQILRKFAQSSAEKIIMQTYHPKSPAIADAFEKNFQSFLKREIASRRVLRYPPFSRIIKLSFSDKEAKKSSDEAKILLEKIKTTAASLKFSPDDYSILGPGPAFIPKKRDKYIWQIVLKINNSENSDRIKKELLRVVGGKWKIDIDPIGIL